MPGSKTFVLVHGVWHGGWCWSRVVDILRARGHRVTTPTQTGLGERAHLLSADITIQTFVEDIVRHLDCEDLKDVDPGWPQFRRHPGHRRGRSPPRTDRQAHLSRRDHAGKRRDLVRSAAAGLAADRKALAETLERRPQPAAGAARKLRCDPAGGCRLSGAAPDPASLPDIHDGTELKQPVGNGLPAHYIQCTDPPYPPAKVALERAHRPSAGRSPRSPPATTPW